MKILTSRLELVAATFEHLSAELESPKKLGILLNTTVEAGWPPGEYDRPAQEFFRDKTREDGDKVAGWLVWYAILKKTSEIPSSLVGAGGFFGPPDNEGKVEIGFSIMPLHRGKGYATEFVNALAGWAFDDNRVRNIVARTTHGNVSARRVIQKAGFMENGAEEEVLTYVLTKIKEDKRRKAER